MKRRADELLKEKPAVAIEMLRRAVKNGYIAKYLLVGKWFFGEDFIKKVRSIKEAANKKQDKKEIVSFFQFYGRCLLYIIS